MTLWGSAIGLLILALVVGSVLARAGYLRWVLVVAAVLAAVLAVLLVVAERMSAGWDGLALAILTVIGLGPVVIGLLAGGLAGWMLRRRAGG